MKPAFLALVAIIAIFTGYLAVSHYFEVEQAKEAAAVARVQQVWRCARYMESQGANQAQITARCNP